MPLLIAGRQISMTKIETPIRGSGQKQWKSLSLICKERQALSISSHVWAASADFPELCFEAGIFLEAFVIEINLHCLLGYPRDFKAGVDSLIERGTIPSPLGYKLHVIREPRNVKPHFLEEAHIKLSKSCLRFVRP
jgi:hypothetical protein